MGRAGFFSLAALLLAFAPPPASADEGWFASFDVGRSKYVGLDGSGAPFYQVPGSQGITSDASSHHFRIAGGYHVTPYLSLEAGYVKLGGATRNANFSVPCEGSEGTGICFHVHEHDEIGTHGYFGALELQSFSLFGLSLYGRADVFIGHTDFTSFDPSVATIPLEQTIRYTGLTYGFGVACAFSPHLTLRLGVDRYPARYLSSNSYPELEQDFHVDTVGLGLVYDF